MDFPKPFLKQFKKLKDKLLGSSRMHIGRYESEDIRKWSEVDVKGGEAS